MPLYPARPGSVRISPDQQQSLSNKAKGKLMAQVSKGYDSDCLKIVHFMLYAWRWHQGVCDPALSTLAEHTGIGLTKVKACVKRLSQGGIFRKINRGMAMGKRFVQWTNAYVFNVLPEDCCEAVSRPPPNKEELVRALRKPKVELLPMIGDLLVARRLKVEAELRLARNRAG